MRHNPIHPSATQGMYPPHAKLPANRRRAKRPSRRHCRRATTAVPNHSTASSDILLASLQAHRLTKARQARAFRRTTQTRTSLRLVTPTTRPLRRCANRIPGPPSLFTAGARHHHRRRHHRRTTATEHSGDQGMICSSARPAVSTRSRAVRDNRSAVTPAETTPSAISRPMASPLRVIR